MLTGRHDCVDPDAHMARVGQRLCAFGDALVTLDPAIALARPGALAVWHLEFRRPCPRIEHAQRLALGSHDVGGMQIQPALGFIAQGPQAGDDLSVVVQLDGVLQAQHHLVLGHARLAGLPVGREHLVPADLFDGLEAVGRRRFCPAMTSARDAGRGLLLEPLCQQHCAPVQALVAQLDGLEFFLAPAYG